MPLEYRHGGMRGHRFRRLDTCPGEVNVERPGFRYDVPGLEGYPHRRSDFDGAFFGGEGQDGGARAGEAGAVGAVLDGCLYDVFEAWDKVGAVGLMEPVLHGYAQEVVFARGQCAEQQARAADVEDGVAVGDGVGEGAAGRRGRDGEVGDGDDDLEVFRFEADGANARGGEGADHEPAEEGRGRVIGVSVQFAHDVEQVGGRDLAPEQLVGRHGTADQGGRAPAQAPGGGNVVLLYEPEVGVRLADDLGHEPRGPVGRMLGPARDEAGAGAPYLYLGMGRSLQPYSHAEGEREPHRVVAGSEVRGRGRDADGGHGALPMNSTTASNVAGAGAGGCTRPPMTSGAFRPWPVNTLTTVPSGALSSPASLSSPAIPAAEAGSQKTPSSWASISWAARISASVTLSMSPPESRAAVRAPSLLAGDPILMALATVSGLSKSWPATSGEAPSA